MQAGSFFTVGRDGWLERSEGVRLHFSPHFGARPAGSKVSLVIIHSISLPPGRYLNGCVEAFFEGRLGCRPEAGELGELLQVRVSSHFFITRTGTVCQFVSCCSRAWHAGASSFLGRDNCNDFSIGIEMEGMDSAPFEEVQYQALEKLLPAISSRFPVRYIAAHSDVAPGRKTDPGPYFDWLRLMRLPGGWECPGAAAQMQKSAREACGILA